jgi:hypothetical protein
MRMTFAHEAALRLDPGADARAPGAGVTAALCGHWEHEGPCRWPHLTAIVRRSGDALTVRVLFAAPPEDEPEVRARIGAALRRGRLDGGPRPGGWTVVGEGSSELLDEEREAAARLTASWRRRGASTSQCTVVPRETGT